MTLIAQVPLFAELPDDELNALTASLRYTRYEAHTLLFREGDHGDRFYIVLDGDVAIIKAMDSPDERLLALRGPGEFVGEMSLLNRDGLRTASARVHTDARVLELTRADFDALLQRHPTLAYEMLRVMSDRLRASHDVSIRELHEKNEHLARAYAELQAAQAQLIEQEALARELRLARDIQQSMLPQHIPQMSGVEIGARMIAARMVGGDFYDVIPLAPDRIGVVIGDVSGKGVPAALFMALTCSLLRAEATRTPSPTAVLQHVNTQLSGMNAKGMFVTALYGVIDRTAGTFSYARAGHELPIMRDQQGTALELALGTGHPLALFPHPALDAQTIELPPGGSLLLYTDGVTDASNPQGEFFGLEQLQGTLLDMLDTSAQELCDQLVDVLAAYQGSAPQFDDITLVAVKLGPITSQ